jgi:uncharacterized protein YdeI (YjbR/CyaY-like superfamily)
LQWVTVRIPFDVRKTWGSAGQFRVKGEINGFPFRTSLFPRGGGEHFLLVNKKMQAGGKVSAGRSADFRLEPDTEERQLIMPVELERALAEDRALRRWFDRLTPSMRSEITRWVADAKGVETRKRRANQLAERLMATMEAEQDLPPILRIAFARNAQAYQGWKLMSASRRRMHLLGVFYYRTPEGQARRVEKVIEDAYALAERKAKTAG